MSPELIEPLSTRIYEPLLSEARERIFAVPSAHVVPVARWCYDGLVIRSANAGRQCDGERIPGMGERS
jgi:hypothetical protein